MTYPIQEINFPVRRIGCLHARAKKYINIRVVVDQFMLIVVFDATGERENVHIQVYVEF